MYSVSWRQVSGGGVIGSYTTTIFQQYGGMTPPVSRVLSGALYTSQGPFALLPNWTIDRLGRRKTSMIGSLEMGLGFVVLAAMTSQPQSKACAIVACMAVFLSGFSFPFRVLGVNYLYGTEVSPLAYRGRIYALTSITLWASSFLMAEVTPVGFAILGWRFFIFWAAFNLFMNLPGSLANQPTMVYFFFFPETSRQTLESMDTTSREAKSVFEVVRITKELHANHVLLLPVGVDGKDEESNDGEKNGAEVSMLEGL